MKTVSNAARPGPAKKRHVGKYVAIAILVIIIASALAAVLHGNGYLSLGTEKTAVISQAPLLVDMHGTYFSVSLASHSGSEALFYVSKIPIFANEALLVKTTLGNTTHVSLGTQYADLGIRLNSFTENSANITLIPIAPALGVAIDYANIEYKSMLPGQQNSSSGVKIIITNSSSNSTQTTTVTTAATTTTIVTQPSNSTKTESVVEKSIWYPLMLNYSAAYSGTSSCTASLYNSSYYSYYGKYPSGPSTYQNTSTFVPYKLNSSISSTQNPYEYLYTYYAYSKSPSTTGKALVIGVNISSMTVVNVTLSGVFQDNNYAALYKGYEEAAGINNACGIEIV